MEHDILARMRLENGFSPVKLAQISIGGSFIVYLTGWIAYPVLRQVSLQQTMLLRVLVATSLIPLLAVGAAGMTAGKKALKRGIEKNLWSAERVQMACDRISSSTVTWWTGSAAIAGAAFVLWKSMLGVPPHPAYAGFLTAMIFPMLALSELKRVLASKASGKGEGWLAARPASTRY